MSSNDPSREREPLLPLRPGTGAELPGGRGGVETTSATDLPRLLIENVRDYAIFALDPDGYILSWNSGAQHLKGYEAEEIIGRHFSIFYEREAKESGFPQFELEVAARDGRFEDEGWRIRKDGSRFWANVFITPLRDAQGTLIGFAKITKDLTERKRAEERAIADARRVAAAEASNRAKSEFLAAMSHELRTPLNAIGGYAELIALGLRGPVTPDQAADLERIRRSQQHLLAIINDLLNYSRIEAGQLAFDISSIPAREALESVVAMMSPQAEHRGLILELERCPAHLTIRADRTKLEQILLNLVSNAIKFTTVGGRISLGCDEDHEMVRIAVTDTGVGIAPDQQDAIFEPFVQVGRSLSNPGEGTGLGLAISRDLAEAMGGSLVVQSDLDTGSTFTLSLPGPDAPARKKPTAHDSHPEHG